MRFHHKYNEQHHDANTAKSTNCHTNLPKRKVGYDDGIAVMKPQIVSHGARSPRDVVVTHPTVCIIRYGMACYRIKRTSRPSGRQ